MKSKPRLVKRLRDKVRRNVFTDGTLSGTLGEATTQNMETTSVVG